MPSNPKDELLRLNAQSMQFLDRLDARVAREIVRVYEETRLVVLASITERRARLATGLGEVDERAVMEALARDQALFAQIEERLAVLRSQVGEIVGGAVDASMDNAHDRAADEVDVLWRGLEVPGFNFAMIDFASVEIGMEDALAALEAEQVKLARVLRSELRGALVRGDAFEDMVARLLAKESSLFVNGEVSATRAARRGVIDANNGARDLYYRAWAEEIPGLMKQAVAAMSDTTTETCLHVHGQVQPLDKPYELTGRKAFASRMMYPAFHWGCRTSSVAWHADFERGSRMTSSSMRERARRELERRRQES